MAKQTDFNQSQSVQHFHQTNMCTHADAGFETLSLSVWQFKNFRTLPECEKNHQQCIFKLKQEIKKSQKYRSNGGEGFFDLLCERILIKILQGFQLPLFTLMLSCCFSVLVLQQLLLPHLSQTSCAAPCSGDLPSLCNVLHMLPWKETEAIMQFPLSKTFLIVLTNPRPNLTLT